MSSEPVRTVIFSGVRHAGIYAQIVNDHPDFDLVGVYESSDAPAWAHDDADRLAERLAIPRLGALPQDADLSIVCSEPTRHAACAREALTANHHVLVDKPAATSPADALDLRALSSERRLVLTAVNRTLLSSIQRARDVVDGGHIGFPRSVDVEFLSDGAQFATAVERPELVVDASLSGGGEIMNFLGYCIDSVRAITGCDPLDVFGFASTAFSTVHRAAGVEDVGVVSVLFTHGVVASITVGRVPAAPSFGPGASTVRIVGSHGHLLVDDNKPAVVVDRDDGRRDAIHAGPGGDHEAVREVLADVCRAIRGSAPLRYSMDDAAIAVCAIAAAYESVRTGRPVRVAALP